MPNVIKYRQLKGIPNITVDDIPDGIPNLKPEIAEPLTNTTSITTGLGVAGSITTPEEGYVFQTNNIECNNALFNPLASTAVVDSALGEWFNRIEALIGRELTQEEKETLISLNTYSSFYMFNTNDLNTWKSYIGLNQSTDWLSDYSCVVEENPDAGGLFKKDYIHTVKGTLTLPPLIEEAGNEFNTGYIIDENVNLIISTSLINLIFAAEISDANLALLVFLELSNFYERIEDGTFKPVFNFSQAQKEAIVEWYNTNIASEPKLTPKSDFIHCSNETATDTIPNVVIYNKDATIKSNQPFTTNRFDSPYIKSVGKGEVAYIDASSGELRLVITKKDGSSFRYIKIDNYVSTDKYYLTLDLFTFLGTPFIDQWDNDRYVICNMLTPDGTTYHLGLINIETMTIKALRSTGFRKYYDIKFDGIDTIYVNYLGADGSTLGASGNRIQKGNLTDAYTTGAVQLGEVLYDDDSRVTSSHLYYLDDRYLIFKDWNTAGHLLRYEISNGARAARNGANVYNLTEIKNKLNTFDNFGWVIYNDTDGFFVMNSLTVNTKIDITQSIIDGGVAVSVLNSTVGKVYNATITDGTNMEFDWVMLKTDSSKIYVISVNTKIVNGVVTSKRNGITNYAPPTLPTIEQMAISIQNTCNSYDIGKFFNYGLQTQWNNRE